MNLSTLFEETTAGPLPPSRARVEDIYRAGVRRRRVSLASRVGLVVVVVAVALVAVVVPFRDDHQVADRRSSRWVVHAVGGFTEQRLWAYVEPCAGCGLSLMTSDNGGRAWTGYAVDVAELHQVTMTTAAGGVALMRHPSFVRVGVSGWGFFRHVEFSTAPVVAAPPDSPVHCVSGQYAPGRGLPPWTDPGTVRVVDITGARYGPTPGQPPFPCRAAMRAPDGVILAAGRDPGTGRAAVARSLDNGSTWVSTALEPDLPDDPRGEFTVADLLASPDGGAVVAFRFGTWSGLYRYHSGSWSRLSLIGPYPDALALTRDNTLIAEVLHGVTPRETRPPAKPSPAAISVPAGVAAFTTNVPGSIGLRAISRPKGIGREAVLGFSALPGGGHVAFNNSRIWTSTDGKAWKSVRLS